MVHFFEQNIRVDAYWLNDLIHEDFIRKIELPKLIPVGRINRVCFLDSTAQLRVAYIASRSLMTVASFSF